MKRLPRGVVLIRLSALAAIAGSGSSDSGRDRPSSAETGAARGGGSADAIAIRPDACARIRNFLRSGGPAPYPVRVRVHGIHQHRG